MSECIIQVNDNDYITVFTATNPLAKQFDRDYVSGEILKEGPSLAFCTAVTHHVPNVKALKKLLDAVSNNMYQAICLGYVAGIEVGVEYDIHTDAVYREHWAIYNEGAPPAFYIHANTLKPTASRTKHCFTQSSWTVLDRDLTEGMPDGLACLNRDQFVAAMDSILPGFAKTPKLMVDSNSGRLIVDGVQQQTRNFHCYFQVLDNEDVGRVGSALLMTAFTKNLGYMKPNKAGGHAHWAIFDPTTFSRERVIYEGLPTAISGKGLEIAPTTMELLNVRGTKRIDTSKVKSPEGDVAGLRMSSTGGSTSLQGDFLHPATLVEFMKHEGVFTVQDFIDNVDGRFSDKEKCQTVYRDSTSWNGYLQRLTGRNYPCVFHFDNGTRIGNYTQRPPIDVNAIMATLNTVIELVDKPYNTDILITDEMVERFVFISSGSFVADIKTKGAPLAWADFKRKYKASITIIVTEDGEELRIPTVDLWVKHPLRKEVSTRGFMPNGEDLFIFDGVTRYNDWYEPVHHPDGNEDGATILREHIEYLIPDETVRHDFTMWLAHMVQKPEERPNVAFLMVTPAYGTGRGALGDIVKAMVSPYGKSAEITKILGNNFNAPFYRSYIIVMEEVYTAFRERKETVTELNNLITATQMSINLKNMNEFESEIFSRILMFTNHIDAMHIEDGDRRIYVVQNPTKYRSDDYYDKVYSVVNSPALLAGAYNWLMNIDLSNYRMLKRAPETAAKKLMREVNLTEMDVVLLDAMEKWNCDVFTTDDILRVAGVTAHEAKERHREIVNVIRKAGCTTSAKVVRIAKLPLASFDGAPVGMLTDDSAKKPQRPWVKPRRDVTDLENVTGLINAERGKKGYAKFM